MNVSLDAIKSDDDNLEPIEDEGSSDFDLEKLQEVWPDITESLRSKNANAASILKGQVPNRSESGNIAISVESVTGKNVIHTVMKDLVDTIKAELKLSSLRVEVNIEATEGEKRPYFPEEIYKHFVEVNPDLEELVRKLNLDFR